MVTTLWWRVEFSGSPAVDSFPGLGLYDCRHCANLLSSPICPQQSPPPASYTSLSYLDLTLVLTGILFATTLCTRDWNPAKSAALCWKPAATRQDAGIPSSPELNVPLLYHCLHCSIVASKESLVQFGLKLTVVVIVLPTICSRPNYHAVNTHQ